MNRKFLTILGLAVTLGFQADAATLVAWNLTGPYAADSGSGDYPIINATTTVGATGTLTPGFGLSFPTVDPEADPVVYESPLGTLEMTAWQAETLFDAGDDGVQNYYRFEVTPDSGTVMNLDHVNFNITGTPVNYRYALFAGNVMVSQQVTGLDPVLLSGANTVIHNLDNLGPTVFTLYIYGPDGAADPNAVFGLGRTDSGDSLLVDGTVTAVPEPSTYVLLLLGLAGMALIARAKEQQPKLIPVKA